MRFLYAGFLLSSRNRHHNVKLLSMRYQRDPPLTLPHLQNLEILCISAYSFVIRTSYFSTFTASPPVHLNFYHLNSSPSPKIKFCPCDIGETHNPHRTFLPSSCSQVILCCLRCNHKRGHMSSSGRQCIARSGI